MPQFNITWLNANTNNNISQEILKVGATEFAAHYMAEKSQTFVFRAENISNPAAHILKQEFLSKGGDVAVHHDVVVGKAPLSPVIMMATAKQYKEICQGLKRQQFKLPLLADEILEALANIKVSSWQIPVGDQIMELGEKTAIMAVLNVTPDSFSDGGSYNSIDHAVECAKKMISDAGNGEYSAVILDVGGESTRPNHTVVGDDEEIARVVPVIAQLKAYIKANCKNVYISIDSYKPAVVEAALEAGADIINDIWGLQWAGDPEHKMAALAAKFHCPVIAMHNQNGTEYGENTSYNGLNVQTSMMTDVVEFFNQTINIAENAGVQKNKLILDIGFGFGKNPEQNMEILAKTASLKTLGLPVLVATSRKSTIGLITDKTVENRAFGTAATVAAGILAGATLVRVHDIDEILDVAKICDVLKQI